MHKHSTHSITKLSLNLYPKNKIHTDENMYSSPNIKLQTINSQNKTLGKNFMKLDNPIVFVAVETICGFAKMRRKGKKNRLN